jgi:VanZ family protein
MKQFLIDLSFGKKYKNLRLFSAFLLYFLVLALGSIPGARQSVGEVASRLIFLILGSLPGVQDDVGEISSGLVLHALTYSMITFLLFTGYAGEPSRKAIQTFMTVASMGALDEFIQSFLSYRTGAVSDWMVDVTAGFLTVSLLVILTKAQLQKSPGQKS